MAADSIPEEVIKFIHANINSVEQLEVLLCLRNNQDKAWSAQEVSQKLYLQPESAAMRLADLSEKNLLQVQSDSEPLYRYQPLVNNLEQVVSSLDGYYKQRKDTIIQLIFSKPLDHIQVFSNAFRFRKRD